MTSGTKGVVHDKKLHDKLVEAVYSKSEAGAEMVRKAPTEQVFSRSASGMTLLDISIMANNKEVSAELISRASPEQLFITDNIKLDNALSRSISMVDKDTALLIVNKQGVSAKHLARGNNDSFYVDLAEKKGGMEEVAAAIKSKLNVKEASSGLILGAKQPHDTIVVSGKQMAL